MSTVKKKKREQPFDYAYCPKCDWRSDERIENCPRDGQLMVWHYSERTKMAKTAQKKLTKSQRYNQDFGEAVSRLVKSRKKTFTVDDVIAKVGTPPQGNKALGALMNAAAFRYDLISVGFTKSQQPSRRGALNRSWKVY